MLKIEIKILNFYKHCNKSTCKSYFLIYCMAFCAIFFTEIIL